MIQDQQRVVQCTTSNFDGLIALINPEQSWVAKWQRIGRCKDGAGTKHDLRHLRLMPSSSPPSYISTTEKRVPGLYAVKTEGSLPQALQERLRIG